jgi:hypothetical protein
VEAAQQLALHRRLVEQGQIFIARGLAQLTDPQTKRSRNIGRFASEEDAARAYDSAVVQARGPGGKCNFPGEDIVELPVTVGEEKWEEERKQRSSSRYTGVCFWNKSSSSWEVRLWDSQTNKRTQHIGYYASEEGAYAARAYDCAAVQARGPGAERKFSGEDIELPVPAGEQLTQRSSSSRYVGVSCHKASASWEVNETLPNAATRQLPGS